MRRIGDLVGIDADQPGRNADLATIQSLGIPGFAGAIEDFAQQGRCKASEGAAAADLHFEKQRLALVYRHAAPISDGLPPPFSREAALVERMAGLVQRAH